MAPSTAARRAAVALGATAAGVAIWSTLIERRLFTVRRHTLPLLAEGAAPLRVLQLSDLHLAPWQENKIEWVRSLAELRPDLVVLTGDLMGHLEAQPSLVRALLPLAESGAAGVFVHGSNDYYGPMFKNPLRYLREPSRLSTKPQNIDNAALTRALSDELGFTDLNNAASSMRLRDSEFEFFGLGDPHIRYDKPEVMREALSVVRSGSADGEAFDTGAVDSAGEGSGPGGPDPVVDADHASPAPAPVRIGVVHAPYQSALGALLDEGAELILAGHTHGGQVRVPGVGALTSNCDLPTEQARGLSVWYDAHRAAYLNVSAGLGNSIYAPVRFACRPEASLLTLEAAR